MEELLSERYCDDLDGIVSCYDRIVITGSLYPFCYAQGMTHYLYQQGIRIFDYAKFAEPLRERIRENAEALAQANGIQIEFIRKKDFRKENRVQQVLKKRGDQPGLVHIFGAMEACSSYLPWHDKATGKTYLKSSSSKCMTYYFYFMDKQLGLCYLRVPTWCPFRLQFYFNGHNWLANQLKQRDIAYKILDNAFVHIDDYAVANQLANEFDVEILHQHLDEFAQQYCPVITELISHITGALCNLSTQPTWSSRTENLCKPSTHISWKPLLMRSNPQILPLFLDANSMATTKVRWVIASTSAGLARASSTRWGRSPSKCTISSTSSCELRRRSTRLPSSSSIARCSIAMVQPQWLGLP